MRDSNLVIAKLNQSKKCSIVVPMKQLLGFSTIFQVLAQSSSSSSTSLPFYSPNSSFSLVAISSFQGTIN